MPEQRPEQWPEPPEITGTAADELASMLYRARLDAHLAREERAATHAETERARVAEADEARRTAAYAAHEAVLKAVVDARLTAITAATERAASAAEFCRNAAAAVVTLYTGLLGLTYSIEDGTPLPTTGAAPSVFLAASLVLASAYVAFLTPGRKTIEPQPHSALSVQQKLTIDAYAQWVDELVSRRSWALRGAVLCLGAGVVLLPAPFLRWKSSSVWVAIAVLAVLVVGLTAMSGRTRQR